MNIRGLSILSLLAIAAAAHSQVIWDESVSGDLSNDRLNPTNLNLAFGVNGLIATTVSGDREYVHFHLSAGMILSHVNAISWSGIDQTGFIGIQAGSTFTEPPTGTNVANLLGYAHYGPGVGNLGQDILPTMGQGAGSIGFTPPLTGSDYSFWLNQTSANPETYRLDFVTTPEPASIFILASGFGLLLKRRKRA